MASKKRSSQTAKKSKPIQRKKTLTKVIKCERDISIDAEAVIGKRRVRKEPVVVTKVNRGIDYSKLPPELEKKRRRKLTKRPGVVMRAIIGDDTRMRVTNTRSFPFHAVCNLTIRFPGKSGVAGTGWLAAPRLIITAGHNIYDPRYGGRSIEMEISPGQDGDDIGQSLTLQFDGENFRAIQDYVDSIGTPSQPDFDYGAILLPSEFSGIRPFEYAIYDRQQLLLETFNIVGYPAAGDVPDSTMWGSAGQIEDTTARRLIYTIDSSAGQSGAPVFDKVVESGTTRYVVVGIHNSGIRDEENYATRIGTEVYQRIERWRAMSEEA